MSLCDTKVSWFFVWFILGTSNISFFSLVVNLDAPVAAKHAAIVAMFASILMDFISKMSGMSIAKLWVLTVKFLRISHIFYFSLIL